MGRTVSEHGHGHRHGLRIPFRLQAVYGSRKFYTVFTLSLAVFLYGWGGSVLFSWMFIRVQVVSWSLTSWRQKYEAS
jgi:hypothetical protein